ncbi:MAG: DUF2218 domain-containing protein [Rhizobiaceae bacterium]|jgi:hypothetical protein
MTTDTQSMLLSSSAVVVSEKASGYLQQLCKHFGHKVAVNFTPERGTIVFDFGNCALAASGNMLSLTATAGTTVGLSRVQHVIASHLERFAFREKPEIVWM